MDRNQGKFNLSGVNQILELENEIADTPGITEREIKFFNRLMQEGTQEEIEAAVEHFVARVNNS